jgi:hypothetical protein
MRRADQAQRHDERGKNAVAVHGLRIVVDPVAA